MELKRYLGDGVYINIDHSIPGQFVMTTENGIETTNEIYIDYRIIKALNEYLADLDREANQTYLDTAKAILNGGKAITCRPRGKEERWP